MGRSLNGILLAALRPRIALRPVELGAVIEIADFGRDLGDQAGHPLEGIVVDVLRLVGDLMVVEMFAAREGH